MAYDPEYHHQYYLANKEKIRQKGQAWADKNREKVREKARIAAQKRRLENPDCYRKPQKEWEERNPEKVLFKSARIRAKNKGLDFDIELSDVVIPQFCPLLNIELVRRKHGHGPQDCSPSLDRIDSSKGYVKGNVWVISWMANKIKTNASAEQIITLAKNLEKILGKK